jgi:uncharacterized membrane protein
MVHHDGAPSRQNIGARGRGKPGRRFIAPNAASDNLHSRGVHSLQDVQAGNKKIIRATVRGDTPDQPSCRPRAVKLIDFLQGKWLGHPLHPALVHVPLGLWLLAAAFDVFAFFGIGAPVLARLSFYCVIGGLLGAFAAVPTGVADWAPIKKDRPAWKLGFCHMILNLGAIFIWAANFGLRLNALDRQAGITAPILISSLVAAGLLLVSGYVGSLMVFDQGTGVGRLSKKKWRSIAERAGSRLPEEK